jgi:hypothetical protein
MRVKCMKCNGDGWYEGFGTYYDRATEEIEPEPIQIPCEECNGEGYFEDGKEG